MCEGIAAAMTNAPTVRSEARAASYDPVSDRVSMPRPRVFESGEGYYDTLFHELTHSTGHASRLNRKGITEAIRFGSPTYTREELVAEMGAAFPCGRLASWRRSLTSRPRTLTAGSRGCASIACYRYPRSRRLSTASSRRGAPVDPTPESLGNSTRKGSPRSEAGAGTLQRSAR